MSSAPFTLPKGGFTDIVANSHNGFFVGTAEDFLAFLKAIAATTPKSAHPSPIEQFLGAHPRALTVVPTLRAAVYALSVQHRALAPTPTH